MPKKNTIGKDEMKSGSVVMTGDAFDRLGGELHAGLNIIKLKPGEAAGPIVVKDILLQQSLGKQTGKKKRKPVDVYVGDANGVSCRLPIAASFLQKLREGNVKIGDTIAFKRGEDYTSQFNTKGASFELRILERGGKSK